VNVSTHGLALRLAAMMCAALTALGASPAFAQFVVKSKQELREEAERALPPKVRVTPASQDSTAMAGGVAWFRVTIDNQGGQTLSWTARCSISSATLTKTSGALGYKGSEVIRVKVPVNGKPGDVIRGTVVVEPEEGEWAPGLSTLALTIVPEPGSDSVPAPRPPRPEPPLGERGSATLAPGMGLHLGYAAPAAGDMETFLGGPTAGVFYRSMRERARTGYEFGLDVVSSDSGDVNASATLLFAGASALFRTKAEGKFYVLGGGRLVTEWVDTEEDTGAIATALDVGGGMALAGGKMDLRATYSILLGSGNVPGFGAVRLGYAF